MSIAALVLAAGRGQRFGAAPKLLAQHRGEPLVRHAVTAALASEARPVLVVVGHGGEAVREALADLPVRFVANLRYADGLSTSLQAGFAALGAEVEGVLVLLGDMPAVTPALLDGIVARWRVNRPAALVPVHAGRRGNPVLLSRALAPEILTLAGDVGAGPLLRARSDVLEWEVPDLGIHFDVDTPEGLAGQNAWVSHPGEASPAD